MSPWVTGHRWTAIVSLQHLKAAFRETQRWSSQSCTKYPAHMFSVWPLLPAGRGQSPASIPRASFLLLWVVSDLNKVGAICWSCRCSSSGQSPYLQPRPNCQGGWPRRGVQREYMTFSPAVQSTRSSHSITGEQYACWISEKCKDLRIQPSTVRGSPSVKLTSSTSTLKTHTCTKT